MLKRTGWNGFFSISYLIQHPPIFVRHFVLLFSLCAKSSQRSDILLHAYSSSWTGSISSTQCLTGLRAAAPGSVATENLPWGSGETWTPRVAGRECTRRGAEGDLLVAIHTVPNPVGLSSRWLRAHADPQVADARPSPAGAGQECSLTACWDELYKMPTGCHHPANS